MPLDGLSLVATLYVRPQVLDNFTPRPLGMDHPADCAGGPLAAMPLYRRAGTRPGGVPLVRRVHRRDAGRRRRSRSIPSLLPASIDPSYSLTIHNTKTGAYSLAVGLIWWSLGMVLAIGYFTFLYRSFAGKVVLDDDHPESERVCATDLVPPGKRDVCAAYFSPGLFASADNPSAIS